MGPETGKVMDGKTCYLPKNKRINFPTRLQAQY